MDPKCCLNRQLLHSTVSRMLKVILRVTEFSKKKGNVYLAAPMNVVTNIASPVIGLAIDFYLLKFLLEFPDN